jgi:hypothetical protein
LGRVALGLHFDTIQSQRVLADHAVQALISGPPQMLCGPGGAAVSHGRQHRQHEAFQERGLPLADPVQHLGGHGRVRLVYRGGDCLARSRPVLGMISITGLFRRPGAALEFDELRKLRQHLEVDPDRMGSG